MVVSVDWQIFELLSQSNVPSKETMAATFSPVLSSLSPLLSPLTSPKCAPAICSISELGGDWTLPPAFEHIDEWAQTIDWFVFELLSQTFPAHKATKKIEASGKKRAEEPASRGEVSTDKQAVDWHIFELLSQHCTLSETTMELYLLGEQRIEWPLPLALEGVKTRAQPVFCVQDGKLEVEDKTCQVSGVTLSLRSRVVAVGDEGRAVTSALLGQQELGPSGPGTVAKWTRHQDLSIAHLAPTPCTEKLEEHEAITVYADMVAKELARRPQVVILDEALGRSSTAWNRTYQSLLQSREIRSFFGAVIVCCVEENDFIQRLCSTRWEATGSCLGQELVRPGARFIDDVYSFDADRRLVPVLQQVTDLAQDNFTDFSKDDPSPDLRDKAEEEGWTVAVLTEVDSLGTHDFLGYLAYQVHEGIGEFHVERVAVPTEHRREGLGTQLIRWACKEARALGLESVWLYAKPALHPFYERLGFTEMGEAMIGEPPDSDDESDSDDSERTYSYFMMPV